MSLLRAAGIMLQKDLLLEWRSRARTNALLFFALATLLLFSFALGPDQKLLERYGGGYLWLALLFASVLSLGESFRVESDHNALEGLRLVPVDPRAIFLGKALGNALLLFGLGLVLLPIMTVLFGSSFALGPARLVLVLFLGCLAISAPGTLFSAIAANARARDVLLPLLLFPLLVPALVACVKATSLVMLGDPMNQLGAWLALLGAFDLVYWSLGFILFAAVLDE